MRRLFIILLLSSICLGDTYTSHQLPIADSTLDLGSVALLWRYIYADSFTDGMALWDNKRLTGFDYIASTTFTDGIFTITGGSVTSGTWHGTDIDISDFTNLIAGTNLTLDGDTLNVDDVFIRNDDDDTTTGTITAGGFTTAGDIATTGTTTTDVLVVGSNPPATATSAGIAGTITYDADWIYVAVANNSWKRASLSTWAIADVLLLDDGASKLLLDDGVSFLLIRP